jgi:hypothetical protein
VVIVMLAAVVQENVYLVSVVARSFIPLVVVQKAVPLALLSITFARGIIAPEVEVLLIQREKVTVEPEGTTPDEFGTPACVSKALMMYSPAFLFFRFIDETDTVAASVAAVLS